MAEGVGLRFTWILVIKFEICSFLGYHIQFVHLVLASIPIHNLLFVHLFIASNEFIDLLNCVVCMLSDYRHNLASFFQPHEFPKVSKPDACMINR